MTNPTIFADGIRDGLANAILIKLNQIGCWRPLRWRRRPTTARSSRIAPATEDASIADLAVGTGAGQIKTGSLCRSERIAKYNRLLVVERELGRKGRYGGTLSKWGKE